MTARTDGAAPLRQLRGLALLALVGAAAANVPVGDRPRAAEVSSTDGLCREEARELRANASSCATSTMVRLRSQRVLIPSDRDSWWCTGVHFDGTCPLHVTEIAPAADLDTLHHLALFAGAGASSCTTSCVFGSERASPVYASAAGGSAWRLPPHVGLRVGASSAVPALHLQAHHRPSHEPMLDSSGVNLQVTSAMRPNDAVFLTAGAVFGFAIPPAQRRFRLRFANRAIFHAPIRIFSIFSHTHGDGVASTAWLLRQGTVLAQIGRSNHSGINGYQLLVAEMEMLPGDELRVQCEFDTRERRECVRGGGSADEEMCGWILGVYPAQHLGSSETVNVSAHTRVDPRRPHTSALTVHALIVLASCTGAHGGGTLGSTGRVGGGRTWRERHRCT